MYLTKVLVLLLISWALLSNGQTIITKTAQLYPHNTTELGQILIARSFGSNTNSLSFVCPSPIIALLHQTTTGTCFSIFNNTISTFCYPELDGATGLACTNNNFETSRYCFVFNPVQKFVVALNIRGAIRSIFGNGTYVDPKEIAVDGMILATSAAGTSRFNVWVSEATDNTIWQTSLTITTTAFTFTTRKTSFGFGSPIVLLAANSSVFNTTHNTESVIIKLRDAPGAFNYRRLVALSATVVPLFTAFELNRTATFDISVMAFDVSTRVLSFDATCSCIRMQNPQNGSVVAMIDMGTGNVPKSITAHRSRLWIVDNDGLQEFKFAFSASILQVKNVTCKSVGGFADFKWEGGTPPYRSTVYPDRVSVEGSTLTTAVVNTVAYSAQATYNIHPGLGAPGDMILFEHRINPAMTIHGDSFVDTEEQLATYGVEPYSGSSAIRVTHTSSSFATTPSIGGASCHVDNSACIPIAKFATVHFAINFGPANQSQIQVVTDSFSNPDILAILEPSEYDPYMWYNLTFSTLKVLTKNIRGVFFRNNKDFRNAQASYFVDDIRYGSRPDGVPHFIIASDDCGETMQVEFDIYHDNLLEATMNVDPVQCNENGINPEFSSNGAATAQVIGGYPPYTYTWGGNITNQSVPGIENLPTMQTFITIYENSLNSSWSDGSGSFSKNLRDTTLAHSKPYSFSFAPVESGNMVSFVSPGVLNIKDFPIVEFMVHGGEFGGQRIRIAIYRFNEKVDDELLERTVESGIILPGVWQKATFRITPSSSSITTYDRISFTSFQPNQLRIYFDDLVLLSEPVLTVTDNSSCPVTIPRLKIDAPAALSYSHSTQNLKCFGDNSGSVTINVQGGTPGYTIRYTDAHVVKRDYLSVNSSLPETKVNVNVHDAHDCGIAPFSINVLQPPPLDISVSVESIQCNGGEAILTAEVFGGHPPYTYSWGSSVPITRDFQPHPVSWFADAPSETHDVNVDGWTIECEGTGSHEGWDVANAVFASHSGYCVLDWNSSFTTVGVNCGVAGCMSKQTYTAIELWVFLASASDASNIQVNITKSGASVSSGALLSSFGVFVNGNWSKVRIPLDSATDDQPDGFILYSGATLGRVRVDDVVLVPTASGSTGVSVNPGFKSIITGAASTYFLVVADANGCVVERNINITEPLGLSVVVNVKNASAGGADGSASVTVTGGSPLYTYTWTDTESTSETASNLATGVYKVVITDAAGCSSELTIFVPSNPSDPTALIFDSFNRNLSGGMAAVVGAGALILIFAAYMFVAYMASFSALGTFFCGVLLLGVLTSYVGTIMLLFEPTDSLCMAYPWLMGIAFVLVYSCLFIKTWTIYRVWSKAKEYQRTNLSPFYIARLVIGALIVEIVFLIIWTVVDPMEARWVNVGDNHRELQCTSDNDVFWIIFLLAKGAWLLLGAVLSILTRDVVKKFNESTSIAYAIYNNIVLLAIGIPLGVVLEKVAGGRLVIMIVIPVLAFTFTMCIMFFKYWHTTIAPPISLSPKLSKASNKTTTATLSSSDSSGERSGSAHSPTSKNIELVVV